MAVNDADLLQTSQLHTWHGIAAEDKAADSIILHVIVPELTPAATGTVARATAQQSVQLTDINGNAVNASVTTGNTIMAHYKGGDSNRKYPPDVVKGEQVTVTKFANADTYYWESLGRDDALRKTETHRFEVANRKDFADSKDDDHTYSVELDTKRNPGVRIKTSKGNGEKFAYQVSFDTVAGTVALADDAGNSVTIDSANAKVLSRNSKGAFSLLNGEDASLMAPRDLTLKAGRQILIDSPLVTISAQSGSGVLAIVANAISQTAKSALTMTSPAIGLNGAVQIPTILTAGLIRAATYANGAPSGTYPAASINLGAGSATTPAVSPDTTMPADQRHSAAWEQTNAALAIVVACFDTIQARIGVPTAQSQITPLATASEMTNLQGT